MAYFTKKNAKIFYELYGDGDDWITLINGYTRPSSDFKLLGSFLAAKGRHVLTFDNRGSGQTETVLDFSIEDIVRDVVDLWDSLDVRRSHVLGISMGGYIAQVLALNEEKRLRSLCLVSTSTGSRGFPLRFDWPKDDAGIFKHLEKFFHPKFVKGNSLLLQAMAKQIATSNKEGEFDRKAKAQQNAITKKPIDEEDLRNLQIPALIIHGRDDQVVSVEEALNLQRLIPNAALHIYEDTGHLILAEQRNDFYARVHEFIDKAS